MITTGGAILARLHAMVCIGEEDKEIATVEAWQLKIKAA
jgi:hypothetical protein